LPGDIEGISGASRIACEVGLETAERRAGEVFGPHQSDVTLYPTGRRQGLSPPRLG